MSKIDFKKQLKHLYLAPKKDFQVVEVPEMWFFKVDGQGTPGVVPEYTAALEALYAMSYKSKFLSKNQGKDYVVPPLEGLWWADDMTSFTSARDKSQWKWTMMIMTPDWITQDLVHQAREETLKKQQMPALDLLRWEPYQEGLSVQILHLGSYDEEGPVLKRLHQHWMPENGYTFNGLHHEIYLSDPRRVEAQKLKTILRQPIRQI